MSDEFRPDSLLASGLEAIRSGTARIIDDKVADPELRIALREISHGIELIMKAILASEHWSLLFDLPQKASLALLKSGEFKSPGFDECLTRIEGVVGIGLSDKRKRLLSSMRKKRNRLEHLGILEDVRAIRSSLGGALHVLVGLIESVVAEGKFDQGKELPVMLAAELTALDTFVKERWNEIRNELGGEEGDLCPNCMQPAALVDGGLRCKFCGGFTEPEDAAVSYLENVHQLSHYETVKDGGNWPVETCPECEVRALVPSNESDDELRCLSCDSRFPINEIDYCCECGEAFRPDDGELICPECWDYKISKD